MIAKDSTSYPCLAVIQHFDVHPAAQEHVYSLGQRLLHYYTEGYGYLPGYFVDQLTIGQEALIQLLDNYFRAAKQFKWGPFHEH